MQAPVGPLGGLGRSALRPGLFFAYAFGRPAGRRHFPVVHRIELSLLLRRITVRGRSGLSGGTAFSQQYLLRLGASRRGLSFCKLFATIELATVLARMLPSRNGDYTGDQILIGGPMQRSVASVHA
jgi:hypothetical protein